MSFHKSLAYLFEVRFIRRVSYIQVAESHNLPLTEVSAKTDFNIDAIFQHIAEAIHRNRKQVIGTRAQLSSNARLCQQRVSCLSVGPYLLRTRIVEIFLHCLTWEVSFEHLHVIGIYVPEKLIKPSHIILPYVLLFYRPPNHFVSGTIIFRQPTCSFNVCFWLCFNFSDIFYRFSCRGHVTTHNAPAA